MSEKVSKQSYRKALKYKDKFIKQFIRDLMENNFYQRLKICFIILFKIKR